MVNFLAMSFHFAVLYVVLFQSPGLLKIHAKNVSGVPIVDTDGHLVGSLSASDLKVIFSIQMFWYLYFPRF
jgi:hypothetical protein